MRRAPSRYRRIRSLTLPMESYRPIGKPRPSSDLDEPLTPQERAYIAGLEADGTKRPRRLTDGFFHPETRSQRILRAAVVLLAIALALLLTFCAVAFGFHPERH